MGIYQTQTRYWVLDEIPYPHQIFGPDTVGIVDESAGGVIIYVHPINSERVLNALIAAAIEDGDI